MQVLTVLPTQSQLTTILGSYYALAGHNHDGVYSPVGHNHDATYAALSHTHAASAITSGTIDPARLGSGTANNTTFLRGDNTWQVVSTTVNWGSIGGTLSNQTDVNNAITARVLKAGDTLTGPLLAADGSSTAPSFSFSGQTNSGIFRNTDGVQIVHNGTMALDCRGSGIFVRAGQLTPASDNTIPLGSFNLRYSNIFATASRFSIGSAALPSYRFDNGSGSSINSGMYAVSTTNLSFSVNGTRRLDLTNTRATFDNAIVAQTLSGASDPTTSDISSGYGAWWKNTTSGEIRWWINDAGVMKKSAALT